MEASGLTTEKILKDTILGSIPFYLQPGETIESMVKQCGGSLIKTIQFLRERSYKDLEQVKPAPVAQVRKVKEKEKEPEDNIIHPKHDFVPTLVSDKLPPKSKSKAKKPTPKPTQTQQDLF